MEYKLKKTIAYTNDPKVKPDKNGNLLVNIRFFLNREEVEATFEPSSKYKLEDVLEEGSSGRLVSWMLSPNKWDKLTERNLVPTWYGEFTFGVVRTYPREYNDTRTHEVKVSLDAEIVPIESKGGVEIGKIADFYVPTKETKEPAKSDDDEDEE